jgi:hypothetical protein
MTRTAEQDVGTARAGAGRRQAWALWGTAAGVLGVITNFTLTSPTGGGLIDVPVVETLSRSTFHASTSRSRAVSCGNGRAAGRPAPTAADRTVCDTRLPSTVSPRATLSTARAMSAAGDSFSR